MEVPKTPRLVEATRFKDGVAISFTDGKSAMYSTALLYAMLSKADELIEELNDQRHHSKSDREPL
jgi:hypothetical protein